MTNHNHIWDIISKSETSLETFYALVDADLVGY
jgi:hypothetical protein